MAYSLSSISSGFNKHLRVEYYDLETTRQRMAAGLNNAVRNSFREVISENHRDAVGVVGWVFKQNGLSYGCRIKDDNNNNVYGFGLEIPKGQEYLHLSDKLTIAEKVHMLTIIEQAMSPAKKLQHRGDFFELEKACFNESLGIVAVGPRATASVLIPQGHVSSYWGFKFANDAASRETLKGKNPLPSPEPSVLRLEWDLNSKIYSIDCSGDIPRFQIGYAAQPNMSKLSMTSPEAIAAIEYAKAKVNLAGGEFSRLCGASNLWSRLESFAEWMPNIRQPY